MDIKLNDRQRQAVCVDFIENTLVLAGAGSGKTKVLTHRIAHILNNSNVHLTNILALTFTNKAAAEMQKRLELLIKQPINYGNWIGTFHSIAHRILRANYQVAGLTADFQILDATEQLTKIKRIVKELNINYEKSDALKSFASFINFHKEKCMRSYALDSNSYVTLKYAKQVFTAYENDCNQNNEVDFAELLLKTYEILLNNKNLLAHYQDQFKYILVDEFQDTSLLQYKILKLLKNDNNAIFFVGDDDQSIYGWRGARVENMTNITEDFRPLSIIKLEQNYRSTATILNAANSVIAHNQNRLSKNLWTKGKNGDLIDLLVTKDEEQEAQLIALSVNNLIDHDENPTDIAVLYRNNALSRAIEEGLVKYKINYVIYGGLRFFDRAEIKNALAYLRLICNQKDNSALLRIINLPARGIGTRTMEKITNIANNNAISLFEAANLSTNKLKQRATNAVREFINLIQSLSKETSSLKLYEKIQYIIDKTGLANYYSQKNNDKNNNKLENLAELVGAAKKFSSNTDLTTALEFIASATLNTGDANTKTNKPAIQLMTMHSAKGLEFKHVFLIGLEEGIFPSLKSAYENLIDEERRLFYVAITRAKEKLYISYAQRRFLYGHFISGKRSRFIREIPESFLNMNYFNNNVDYDTISNNNKTATVFNKGDKVVHDKFGLGVINNYAYGDNPRVEVTFTKYGTKWLMLEYARLEKLSLGRDE